MSDTQTWELWDAHRASVMRSQGVDVGEFPPGTPPGAPINWRVQLENASDWFSMRMLIRQWAAAPFPAVTAPEDAP